jgi:hypothetical protein
MDAGRTSLERRSVSPTGFVNGVYWLLVKLVPAAYVLVAVVPYVLFLIFMEDPWATPTRTYFYRYFDLDEEANVAAWFSSSLLLLCSLACLGLYGTTVRSDRRTRLMLGAGSLVFLYLSMDESGRLHEFVDRMLVYRVVSYFVVELRTDERLWTVVALPMLGLFAYAVYREVKINAAQLGHVWKFLLAGMLYWAFALLIETTLGSTLWQAQMLRLYRVEVLVEESAEVLGTFLFLLGLLRALELELRAMEGAVEVPAPVQSAGPELELHQEGS